jgi:hypothetical protein
MTHRIANVRVARSPLQRLVGLMGRKDLAGAFLLIPRCNSIHTCFMRGAIDVAFLDDDESVVEIHPSVPPWRFVVARKGISVLELPPGHLAGIGAKIGDKVECLQN